jgi:hypothetical protein
MLSGGGAGLGQLRRIRYTGVTSVPPPDWAFEFRAPFPTPSSGSVSFAYQLSAEAEVTLRIYDLGGRLVREVLRERQGAGPHGGVWDGHDRHGRTAGAGIYVAALTVGGERIERRFALVR